MKKLRKIFWSIRIITILSVFTITSCERDNPIDNRDLLGTWISTDLIDTLEFTSDKDFYKMYSGVPDHFNYELSKDSITIQYSGMMDIYIFPTTHYFQFEGNELTIDFRPGCYGLRGQIVKFARKQ